MADAVIPLVIERLSNLLIEKIGFLKGVRQKVERLKNDLVQMQCFPKDADQRQDEDDGIRNWLQRLRRTSLFNEDKDIVGFEKITQSLVAELLKEDQNRSVVSIVGMGGAGKTTLAKKVYNHADVRTRFNCRAWVCISSSYNHKETLRAIIKQLNPITNQPLEMLERMQEQDLEQKLHQGLHDKHYLVALDDIWKEEALLLTSRSRDVAKHADALSHPHELETLGQLFLRKALGHGANVGCPLDFEEVGQKIARRCAGPPLAITVIGALLLGKKKLESEWEKVLNNINTYLSRSKSGVSAILELKGVMQKRDAENLEETAAYYVEQLFSRNMVQVAETAVDERIKRNMVRVAETAVDERIKSCRVHDLLRELAISKAKEENFFQIHEIRDGEILAESSLSFESFGKLSILDLENVRINSVPEEIGEVRFLRDQEDLRDMQVEKAALPQLQCLRIRNCRSLRVLPEELKHVSTLDKLELVDMSKDFVSRRDAGVVSNVPKLKIF
nr:putative disease resistance protein At1g50180 [Coffea arabica]